MSLVVLSVATGIALARGSGSTTREPSASRHTSTAEDGPAIGGWPDDADGDGQISDTAAERIPELVKAAGDHGIAGYVRYSELEGGPQPSNPQEAAEMGFCKEYTIDLYAADGITVLDTYTLTC